MVTTYRSIMQESCGAGAAGNTPHRFTVAGNAVTFTVDRHRAAIQPMVSIEHAATFWNDRAASTA
ncbi:MAG TPA: hypothetical protein VLB69_13070 [Rudaea sp.]|nr:hypothetical protein [Rudaea sp.]